MEAICVLDRNEKEEEEVEEDGDNDLPGRAVPFLSRVEDFDTQVELLKTGRCGEPDLALNKCCG